MKINIKSLIAEYPNKQIDKVRPLLLFYGLPFLCLVLGFILLGLWGSPVVGIQSLSKQEAGLQIMKHPISQLNWQTYNLPTEGNYVLRIVDNHDIPLEQFIREYKIYITADSVGSGQAEERRKVFIPSSGESLVELNALPLLREEGLNLSFKANSLIYLVAPKENPLPNLQAYKLGPASSFPETSADLVSYLK